MPRGSPIHRPRVILVLITLVVFTDLVVYNVVVPFLPGRLVRAGLSETAVGLLFGAQPLAQLLALPLVGWLCRRVGARRTLQIGAFLMAVSCLLFPVVDSYAFMLTARAFQGVASCACWTAGMAILAAAYPARERGRTMGTATGAAALGTLLAPPLGGFLYDTAGYAVPFLVVGIWGLLLGFALLLLPQREVVQPGTVRQGMVGSRWRGYLIAGVVVIVGAALLSFLEPTLPDYLEERLGAEPTVVGLLFGLAALVYGVTSPLAGWASDRWGRRPVMIAGMLAAAVTLPLVGLPTTFWGEACVLALFGAACSVLLSPALPEFGDVAEARGGGYETAYGIFNTGYAVGMVIGPVSGGVLVASLGFGRSLLVFSMGAALGFVVLVGASFRRKALAA